METNKLVIGVMAAFIGIVMLAAVLMPVLNDATTVNVTIENDGVPFAAVDEDEHTITITATAENPIVITVDGEVSELPDLSLYGSATVVYADDTFVRLGSNGAVTVYGKTDQSTYGQTNIGVASDGVSISITADEVTVTNSDSTVTRIIPNMEYYICPTGDYRLSLNPYVKSDSNMMGAGISTISNKSCALVWQGTMDNITTVAVYPSGRTATFNSINTTEITEYKDVYRVDSVVLDWADGGPVLGSPTYTYFIAPASFTAEKAVHLDPAMNGILNVIPVLIIVAILLGVLAAFITRRE